MQITRLASSAVVVVTILMLSASCNTPKSISVKQAISGEKNVVVEPLNHNDDQRMKYFFYEAVEQQNKGNYDAAFDLLTHCLTINPNAAEVYFTIASY